MLAIIVPLRVALGGASWFTRLGETIGHRLAPVGSTVGPRVHFSPRVRDVAFALLATRVATFAVGFMSNVLFPPRRLRPFAMPFRRQKLAELFAAWDSGWYFDIARRGYYFNPDGQSSIAFFPLYPLGMRAIAWPFGGSDKAIWTAGILLSCGAFAGALLAIHRLTERVIGDREVARRAILTRRSWLLQRSFSLCLSGSS